MCLYYYCANKIRQILLLFCIFYVASFLFLFYTIRRGLANAVLYMQRYIYIILRSLSLAALPMAKRTLSPVHHLPSSFFLPSLVSVFLLAAFLVYVVPWPTSCQPSQLASAPGNFSFRIKLHGISRLPSLLFLVFLPFPLSDLSFKLWLFEEYKRNILSTENG